MEKERKQTSSKRKIVWIFNIVVAALCLLSIICYFFGPVWQVKVSYTISADDFKQMIGEKYDFDANEVIGSEGETVSASLSLTAENLFDSFFAGAEESVNKIIDSNVDSIVSQLSGTINGIARKTVKSAAKQLVKDEVHKNIQKFLTEKSEDGSEVSSEEVQKKLDELGFTDDYIAEKTDKIIDDVFEGGSDIDKVTGNIMDTVDEVYADFKKNAEGKEGYEDLVDVELSEEDKTQIEDVVRDTLEELAQEDGTIDPDALIAELLMQAMGATGGGEKNPDGGEGKASPAASPIASLLAAADETPTDEPPAEGETPTDTQDDANTKLATAVKDKIYELIPEGATTYIVLALRIMTGLMLLSMLPWVYILIKLLVKVVKRSNPAVKLALPIWLGWLFYLILAGIPGIAIFIIFKTSLLEKIVTMFGAGTEILSRVAGASVSIQSISWISAIAALVIFAISIFYMVMRRKIEKEESGMGYAGPADEEDLEDIG